MAYNSVNNGKAFRGAPSPWAKTFASIVTNAWVSKRARSLFALGEPHSPRQFVAVPKIGRCRLEAIAFYAPKLGGDQLEHLVHADDWGDFSYLSDNWSQFGRAFVHFRINPNKLDPLEVLDHDGSIRIVNELIALDRQPFPSLANYDDSLGCSLQSMRENNDRALSNVTRLCSAAAEPNRNQEITR